MDRLSDILLIHDKDLEGRLMSIVDRMDMLATTVTGDSEMASRGPAMPSPTVAGAVQTSLLGALLDKTHLIARSLQKIDKNLSILEDALIRSAPMPEQGTSVAKRF